MKTRGPSTPEGVMRRRRGLCSAGLLAAAVLAVTLAWTAFVQGPAPRSAAARTARAATKQKKKAPNREVIDLEDFDAWEVLSLPPDADKQKIRRRFRKLVATQHPDKRPNDPDAKAKFMQIKKAYEQLMGGFKPALDSSTIGSAREFLGEEEDLPPPEVPGGLYVGLSILICVLAYGTYWALNK
ncbi:Chaperone protein DnaJ [Symbiodinium microadriaticum]|uniref:Chaperone protein DnaJ n=1 Tax=Symbiodinium microadriaticum TaxID=2951 RepID=A0A1Q9EZQ1_SYMMI|nr:Chaperone protein DnaJ [Symbiodinium microadriaticum]